MKAVIIAGGKGTRLRSVSEELPKPMVPVLGKPILEYQVEALKGFGINDIIMMIGYKGEQISGYFGDGESFGVHISYVKEEYPMGTAGALYFLGDSIDDDFLLIMGDLMLSVDFSCFEAYHRKKGGMVTLFVHPNSHPYDSDVIVLEKRPSVSDYSEDICGFGKEPKAKERGGRVAAVLPKSSEREGYYHDLVNSGVYLLSKEILKLVPAPSDGQKVDLDKDLIRPLIDKGEVYAYHSTEYVKDIGTPERYALVTKDLERGLIAARNLKNKQKCIFLDRDGTLNEYVGFLRKPKELKLLPEASEAVRLINDSEYLAVVVTNQPVVARGETSLSELDYINAKLETELGKEGAYLDDIFICPHHKDKGFEGEIKELKFNCRCRKPETGLIYEAAKSYNIDLSSSYIIGDTPADVECGKKAGLKTVLLRGGRKIEGKESLSGPDLICGDVLSAVKAVLKDRKAPQKSCGRWDGPRENVKGRPVEKSV